MNLAPPGPRWPLSGRREQTATFPRRPLSRNPAVGKCGQRSEIRGQTSVAFADFRPPTSALCPRSPTPWIRLRAHLQGWQKILRRFGWVLLALGTIFPLGADCAFPQQYCSISTSRQFAVYCTDNNARFAISSAAEEIKNGVLSVLQQKDFWKAPIVINVQRQDPTEPRAPISRVQMIELDQGFKVELDIRIGQDPHDFHFQEQLVKAILLELAYRNRPPVKGGTEYTEPPDWMVEGILQVLQTRGNGIDPEIFKALIDTNRLMPLRQFIAQRNVDLDSASEALFKAYSLCLVTLLNETSNGPYHLAQFLRTLPESKGDAVADLTKAFPDLGKSEQTMEKWWALSIARLATEGRYLGLTLAETEERLSGLLQLKLAAPDGTSKSVELAQAKDWIKEKAAQPALIALCGKLFELSTIANPLLRPILLDYQSVVTDLSRGKLRGTPERLGKLSKRRSEVLKWMNDIEDTMNWFEATQMKVKSNVFDPYLRKSKEWEKQAPPRTDEISRALDAMEIELK